VASTVGAGAKKPLFLETHPSNIIVVVKMPTR
jgi:hypothetical protein